MTKLNEIYKCEICGNITEVLHEGEGELVCCGQPMKLLEEKTEDVGKEKHVPIIQDKIVKVGAVEHPMEEKHYIEWIEAIGEVERSRIFLKPGMKPEAEFCFIVKKARIYCNVHRLWKSTS